MSKYSAVPIEEPYMKGATSAFDYSSAFSYKSAFDYDADNSSHYKSAFDFGYGPGKPNAIVKKTKKTFTVMVFISMVLTVASYLVIALTFPCSLWFCLKKLEQWERLIIFRIGHLRGSFGPGMVFVIPWLDRYTRMDMRTKAFSVPPQQLITVDNGIIEMGCEVKYRVSDVERLTTSVTAPEHGLRSYGKVVLLNVLSKKTVSEMEKDRSVIASEVLKELNARVVNWGVEIGQIELSTVTILKDAEENSPLKPILDALGNKSTPGMPDMMEMAQGMVQGLAENMNASGKTDSTSLLDFGTIAKMAGLFSNDAKKTNPAEGSAEDLIKLSDDSPVQEKKGSAVGKAPVTKLGRYLQGIVSSSGGADLSAGVYRLQVEGEDGGIFVIVVANGTRQVMEGDPPGLTADVSVVVSREDLTAVLEGTLSPLQAYLSGRFSVQGNIQLLMGLETLKQANTCTQKDDMFVV